MIVHQVLSAAGEHDAVTTMALAFRARFRAWGWGGRDFAVRISPGMGRTVASLARLQAGPDDVLLLHHSAYAPYIRDLLTLRNRKLLLYHNITPANWLWDVSPVMAAYCAAGRAQLPELVQAVDVAAAVSRFNAGELEGAGAESVAIVPPLLDGRGADPMPHAAHGAPVTVLFVGRLSPHKRQDRVIAAFAAYRRVHAPQAQLELVGSPITLAHQRRLATLAESAAPGAVRISSGLSDAELAARYRTADAFLCLSEHEGFCLPLLEAFRNQVPVVAKPAGAIPEVAGDAALLVDDDDPAVVAELLHLALSDLKLRQELVRRGRERAAAYEPARVEPALRAAVERAGGRADR